MNSPAVYRIDRQFDAPRALVWRTWTEPDLLARWYGPGVKTIIHGYDLRPGGAWLNEMQWGDKSDLSKMAFLEVVPQEKLVWNHSSTNRDWTIIANPMMPDWPRVLLTTVTFEDREGGTLVKMTQVPVGASAEEEACFARMMAGMSKGWGGGFAVIDQILSDLKG